MSYRITEYYAENFKRLKLIRFRPQGRVTTFTGKNGQGKTSALDVIPFVLGGTRYSPDKPLRIGAKHLECRLTVEGKDAAFTVRRTKEGFTLEMAQGCKAWDTPQKMLNSIFDEYAFEPLEFMHLSDTKEGRRKQVEIVRKSVVIEADFEKMNELSAADANARRDVNVSLRNIQGEILGMTVQEGLPKEPIDIAEIEAELSAINERNRGLAKLITERQRLTGLANKADLAATQNNHLLESIPERMKAAQTELEDQRQVQELIGELYQTIETWTERTDRIGGLRTVHIHLTTTKDAVSRAAQEAINDRRAIEKNIEGLQQTRLAAEAQAQSLSEVLAEAQEALQNAPPAEAQDTQPLLTRLNAAQVTNREIEKRTRLNQLRDRRDDLEQQSRKLSDAIEAREQEKRDALAKAKFPVEGMSVNEEEVLLDGVPISQLGEAEQLKVSIQLIMARNPKLRLVRIPHGEALDDDNMKVIEHLAEELDFYVWVAKVDPSGKIGIYIEDGEVKAVNQ